MQTFVKRRPDAPAGFYGVEAAGLRWLDAVRGGVPVAQPLQVERERIVLTRFEPAAPSAAAAEELGRRLAVTHRAGARWFGCPPDGWNGNGFIGPLVLPHPDRPQPAWGPFYARYRLAPFLTAAVDAGSVDPAGRAVVERLCERLAGADADLTGPASPPARIHGDLWSGNVLWTAGGAVLIDPAAHGGHRESDLAMLALFGLPLLDRVIAGYDEVWPLEPGWRGRVALHQLHPLLVHAALFGSGYGRQAVAAARRYG